MKMYFKQKFFSWFDSYDVYNEKEEVIYRVKGQFSWGHCLKVFDSNGNEVATLKERVFTWLPIFEVYVGDRYVGIIKKEFSFFKPKFTIDFNGWAVDGNFFEWDYRITETSGAPVATVSKDFYCFTDAYSIEVERDSDALYALMLVLAIDAEKCSRSD